MGHCPNLTLHCLISWVTTLFEGEALSTISVSCTQRPGNSAGTLVVEGK